MIRPVVKVVNHYRVSDSVPPELEAAFRRLSSAYDRVKSFASQRGSVSETLSRYAATNMDKATTSLENLLSKHRAS